MKILADLEQGSDQWKAARAGKVTASRAKDARDKLKSGAPSGKQTSYAAQVAVERIAGRPIDKAVQSWQMREGQEQEPLARNAYDVETGNVVKNDHDETIKMMGVVRDITEEKASASYLQHLAHFDPLTGLPNRRVLEQRLR